MNDEDKDWFQQVINSVIAEEISEELANQILTLPHFVDFMRDAKEELFDDDDDDKGPAGDDEEVMAPKVYEMVCDFFNDYDVVYLIWIFLLSVEIRYM